MANSAQIRANILPSVLASLANKANIIANNGKIVTWIRNRFDKSFRLHTIYTSIICRRRRCTSISISASGSSPACSCSSLFHMMLIVISFQPFSLYFSALQPCPSIAYKIPCAHLRNVYGNTHLRSNSSLHIGYISTAHLLFHTSRTRICLPPYDMFTSRWWVGVFTWLLHVW